MLSLNGFLTIFMAKYAHQGFSKVQKLAYFVFLYPNQELDVYNTTNDLNCKMYKDSV